MFGMQTGIRYTCNTCTGTYNMKTQLLRGSPGNHTTEWKLFMHIYQKHDN